MRLNPQFDMLFFYSKIINYIQCIYACYVYVSVKKKLHRPKSVGHVTFCWSSVKLQLYINKVSVPSCSRFWNVHNRVAFGIKTCIKKVNVSGHYLWFRATMLARISMLPLHSNCPLIVWIMYMYNVKYTGYIS